MGISDWNYKHPVELQDYAWDCAAAATAWALQAAGVSYTEQEVIAGLGPERISPTYGLLDASGAGIVDWLATIGITALNDAEATWDDIVAAAGFQPMIMGGRQWYHWTGVRMGPYAIGQFNLPYVLLANPAPGYMGVGQYMSDADFHALGPFSAVWLVEW